MPTEQERQKTEVKSWLLHLLADIETAEEVTGEKSESGHETTIIVKIM